MRQYRIVPLDGTLRLHYRTEDDGVFSCIKDDERLFFCAFGKETNRGWTLYTWSLTGKKLALFLPRGEWSKVWIE